MSAERWTPEQALDWAQGLPRLSGCNYVPASAINQIEMWSEATWDPERIRAELRAARKHLGYNALRVYLHDLVWEAEGAAFLDRIDAFLGIADNEGFTTLFVIFDDCWHEPRSNPQPAPRPGIHNSGWARSPGRDKVMDRSAWPALERYVRAVVRRFGRDRRVLGWDIYNEVGNVAMSADREEAPDYETILTETVGDAQLEAALTLCEAAFGWVRAEGPEQPLTAAVYEESHRLGVDSRIIPLSDVVSFHHYESEASLHARIHALRAHGRPLMCTEYLNRKTGATFATHLTTFAAQGIPAFAWGLVDGKTQTKFSWTDRPKDGAIAEPDPWFHDTLRADLTPYDVREAAVAKELMS